MRPLCGFPRVFSRVDDRPPPGCGEIRSGGRYRPRTSASYRPTGGSVILQLGLRASLRMFTMRSRLLPLGLAFFGALLSGFALAQEYPGGLVIPPLPVVPGL